MSEPTGAAVPEDPDDARAAALLRYEREAYQAAENGELDRAVEVWSDILTDAGKRAFFAEEDGMVAEIAANLADVYLRKGDDVSRAEAVKLRDRYSLEFVAESDGSDTAATSQP
ncbi:MAG TPA: hypothetical protein VHF06_07525 [Pseudonocardiaceae bacterium]|jgi:hypothetical protein|nr:hypothetical protein [Pseudonocardiaceae bacterium]